MDLHNWSNYYVALGTASATLTGLMFIAVTFGAKLITNNSIKAAQAFLNPIINHFALSFFLSSIALIPESKGKLFASLLIVFSIVRIVSARHTFAHLYKPFNKEDIDYSDWIISLIIPNLIYIVMIISGIGIFSGNKWALFLSALSILSLISIGIINAWQMLVWMAYKLE